MAGSGAPTILVTRPQPGADATAADLAAIGFNTIVVPFTETASMPVESSLVDANRYQAIAVTSAAAIRHLPQKAVNTLAALPVYAVGAATAQRVKEAGFQSVFSADGDASALAIFMRKKLSERDQIAYLCGQTRSPAFEEEMTLSGLAPTIIETYQTIKVSQLTYKLQDAFSKHLFDGVVLYSGVSASLFAAYWAENADRFLGQTPNVFCISRRAFAQLPAALQARAHICDMPNHEAMIALIRQHNFRS